MTNLVRLKGLSLLGAGLSYLKKNKINIPRNAKSVDIIHVTKGEINTSIYTFRDCENCRIKLLKINKNLQGQKKEIQARFYKYNGVGNNKKLSNISSFKFNSENKFEKAEFWNFYRPYFSDKIFFSRKSSLGSINNFLKTEDYIEDKLGIRLKPISTAEFLEIKKSYGGNYFVGKPWTLENSITSDVVVTDEIKECTVVGIIGENGISLNHLNPNNSKNDDLVAIAEKIKEQIDNKGKKVKAFLLGSVEIDKKSNQLFFALKNILEEAKIPFSVYKTGDAVIKNCQALLPLRAKLCGFIRSGRITPFLVISGQHIVCEGNEIKIANMIIDKELANGNNDALDMIKKSFSRLNNL